MWTWGSVWQFCTVLNVFPNRNSSIEFVANIDSSPGYIGAYGRDYYITIIIGLMKGIIGVFRLWFTYNYKNSFEVISSY